MQKIRAISLDTVNRRTNLLAQSSESEFTPSSLTCTTVVSEHIDALFGDNSAIDVKADCLGGLPQLEHLLVLHGGHGACLRLQVAHEALARAGGDGGEHFAVVSGVLARSRCWSQASVSGLSSLCAMCS